MLDVASIEEMKNYLLENPQMASLLSGYPLEEIAPDERVIKSVHYNKPQLRSMLIGANEETAVWGRGTGKSEGLIAPKAMRNMEVMPRSRGGMVGRSYLRLLENTIPPVIKGWENMGYVRNKDFWVREKPPKSLDIPTPIVGPLTADHAIFHRNGSVISLISQDRPSAANGTTLHWIVGDEAKSLDKKRYDNDLMPANRGDERYWEDVPELHSVLLATDMPTSKEARWILEKKAEMVPKRIEAIMALQLKIFQLTKKLIYAQGQTRVNVVRELGRRRKEYDLIRAKTNYFSLASTLDNLEGFGVANLERLKRILPDFVFMTSILNKEPFLTDNAFYPDLSDAHLYDDVDYAYVDSVDWEKTTFDDCRKDADLNPSLPLHIGADYNASINPIAIGQPWRKKDLKIINAMYVRHPERLRDVALAFCNYYRFHRAKHVIYHYDHTATYGSAQATESPADEFCGILRAHGWSVDQFYIGHTKDPEDRYELWGKAFRGADEDTSEVIINRENCNYLITSMRMTKIVQKATGFKKDKNDEGKPELDQRETTHFSDAGDTLLVGYNQWVKYPRYESADVLISK